MNTKQSRDALNVIGFLGVVLLVVTIIVLFASKNLKAEQQIATSAVLVGSFVLTQWVQNQIIAPAA